MSACAHRDDVGSYVLRALPDDELERFEAHLTTCEDCRRDVAELQVAADTLPLAAVQVAPPPELRDRIMATVRSEADLLSAAGARADEPAREPAAKAPPRRERRRWWALRPLPAVGLATAVLAVAVVAGVLVVGGDDTHTVQAKVTLSSTPDARASLEVTGTEGKLTVRNFPPAGGDRVYEAWRMRNGKPVPAGLFRVGDNGGATLAIDESLKSGDQVLVTVEPGGGSAQPTSKPIVAAAVPA
jgi:anti-sigma-K factor RskA